MTLEASTASKPNPSTTYLVAIDGTPSDAFVLHMAGGLVTALAPSGMAELNVVHVLSLAPSVATMGMDPQITSLESLEAGRDVLNQACALAMTDFKGAVKGHLAAGEPWREVTQLALNLSADLLIVGSSGKTGLARFALGSVAEKVVRHANCPVLVARPKNMSGEAVPEIEAPCPDCALVQKDTERATLWCDRHAMHHARGRLHYEFPPTFGVGSIFLRP